MNIVYTLDKLIIDFTLETTQMIKVFSFLRSGRGVLSRAEIKHWNSNSVGGFKENFTLTLDGGNSFYFAAYPNWIRSTDWANVARLEFNPAKVGNSIQFRYLHAYLLARSKKVQARRFDVAIDLPLDRRDVFLHKDRRQYRTIQNSALDKTEYLGQRSQHGQVKVYNKRIESGLDYDLTRVEITVDFENNSYDEFVRLFPDVTYLDTGQTQIFEVEDNDRVLIMACLEHPEWLAMLSRYKRKKIERALESHVLQLQPSYKEYMNIVSQCMHYCNKRMHDYMEIVKEYKENYRKVADELSYKSLERDAIRHESDLEYDSSHGIGAGTEQ